MFGNSWIREFCGANWLNKLLPTDRAVVNRDDKEGKSAHSVITMSQIPNTETGDSCVDRSYNKVIQDFVDLVKMESARFDVAEPQSELKTFSMGERTRVYVPDTRVMGERPCEEIPDPSCRREVVSEPCSRCERPQECVPDPVKSGERPRQVPVENDTGQLRYKMVSDGGVTEEKHTEDIFSITPKKLRSIEELKKSSVFDEGVGTVKNYRIQMLLKEDSQPISLPSRS